MHGHLRPGWRWLGLSAGLMIFWQHQVAWAIFLDQEETLRFSGRVYNRSTYATQDAADNTRLRTPYNSWNMT